MRTELREITDLQIAEPSAGALPGILPLKPQAAMVQAAAADSDAVAEPCSTLCRQGQGKSVSGLAPKAYIRLYWADVARISSAIACNAVSRWDDAEGIDVSFWRPDIYWTDQLRWYERIGVAGWWLGQAAFAGSVVVSAGLVGMSIYSPLAGITSATVLQSAIVIPLAGLVILISTRVVLALAIRTAETG